MESRTVAVTDDDVEVLDTDDAEGTGAFATYFPGQSEQNRSDSVWSFRILTMPPDHLSGVRPTAMLCGAGRVRRRAWPGGGESTWRSFDAKPVEASSLGYRGYRVHCIITVSDVFGRTE